MMKKIAWITPTCYVDVDLPIIKELQTVYDIHWFVILQPKDGENTKTYIENTLGKGKKVLISYEWQMHRMRSVKNIVFVYNLIRKAKADNAAVYYTSEYAQPFGVWLYKWILPIDKTIAACHNVTTPKGANHEKFARFYTAKWLSSFKNIQTFSYSQCKALTSIYKHKNVLMAHLALKDYGMPTKFVKSPKVTFLVFGNIVRYKRIDLLLKAVNILNKRGVHDFNVKIAGNCKDWDTNYAPIIECPELYDLDIRRIPNEDVANLFAESDYFVMPYQDIAQSGAITVAFRYNIPVLCSDIEQFTEFVTDGVTGFTFKSQDERSLADKMEWIMKNHQQIYNSVKMNEQKFVDENLALNTIVGKYKSFIDKL